MRKILKDLGLEMTYRLDRSIGNGVDEWRVGIIGTGGDPRDERVITGHIPVANQILLNFSAS